MSQVIRHALQKHNGNKDYVASLLFDGVISDDNYGNWHEGITSQEVERDESGKKIIYLTST